MALFGRVGNILRHATNRKMSSELCSFPSVFQAIRCFSNPPSTKLFVGGVSYTTDEQSFREIFSKYGEVVDARLIIDRETGRHKGYGFITYITVEEASSAIQALDGQDVHGRRIGVNFANERPRGFGGGGGGFDGSYGNNPYGAGAGTGYQAGYGNSPYGAASSVDGYGDAGGYGGNVAGGNPGGYGNSPYGAASSGGEYGGNVAGGNGSGGYGGGGYGSGSNFGGSSINNDYYAYDITSSAGGGYGGSGMNHGNDGRFASGNTYNDRPGGGYGGNNGNYDATLGGGESKTSNYGTAPDVGGYGSYGAAAGFGKSDNHENPGGYGNNNAKYGAVVGGGESNTIRYGSAPDVGGYSSNGFAASQYSGSAMGYGSGGSGTGSSFSGGYDRSGGLGYGSSGQLDSNQSSNVGGDCGDSGAF